MNQFKKVMQVEISQRRFLAFGIRGLNNMSVNHTRGTTAPFARSDHWKFRDDIRVAEIDKCPIESNLK